MTEEETLARNSTPGLRRNVLSREAKKRNMEFDSQYAHMTRAEREEFLDIIYPEDIKPKKENPDEDGRTPELRPRPGRDEGDGAAETPEKAEATPDPQEAR